MSSSSWHSFGRFKKPRRTRQLFQPRLQHDLRISLPPQPISLLAILSSCSSSRTWQKDSEAQCEPFSRRSSALVLPWMRTDLKSAISKLAEVLLPDELADARGALASDNLELRDRLIAEVPQLTSAEIGEKAGLRTKNPYATAARWKKSGDIFSVQHRGKEYFPAFQFREGRPHPTVKKALDALPSRLSPWQRAFWFVSTNGWLSDKAPADVLDDPHAVAAAAEREGEEVIG